MNTLHSILSSAFDVVLCPFSAWPLATLLVVSAVSGVLMAVVFRYTSNQTALRNAVDRARAELLAIKLFKDDPWVTFVSLKELLKQSGLRLWHSLPPLLVMAIPVALLLVQLAMRFERRPALPHEPILVEAVLTEKAWPRHKQLVLEVPSSIQITAGPHRDPQERMLTWSLEAREAGNVDLRFQFDSGSFLKRLAIANSPAPLTAISHATEPSTSLDTAVETVCLHYPHRRTSFFGFTVSWWSTFLIVAMLFALLARPLSKVQF